MYELSIVNVLMIVLLHSNEAYAASKFEQKYFEIQESKSVINVYKRYNDLSIQECASLCMDIARAEECSAAGYNFRSRECQLSSNGIQQDVDDVKAVVISSAAITISVPQDCGIPATITNGDLTYGTTNYGSTATVSCNVGYVHNVAAITCLAAGVWELAACSRVDCGIPTTIANGALTYGTTNYGSTSTVSCSLGYVHSVTAITCLDTGMWELATCNIVDCGIPTTISNGEVDYGATNYDSTATVNCNAGYNSSVADIKCLDTGLWELATCSSVDCGIPTTIANGELTLGTTTYGSTATVNCSLGYVHNVTAITCLDTGMWELATCSIVDCGIPATIANGDLTYGTTHYDSTASVNCNFGYSSSAADVKCLETSFWELVTCNIVGCGPIQYTNTNVTYVGGTAVGATVSVSFQDGVQTMPIYESISAICESDGNWVWSTFAHFETSTEVWELMFRGKAEIGYDLAASYLDGTTNGITTSDPACMFVQNTSCSMHYRNPKLDAWSSLGVHKVRYEMYNDGEAVMSVTVDGTGTTMDNWLFYGGGTWRALEWPWIDLTASSRGWWALTDWDTAEGRSFRIIQNYSYCVGDYYYTVVLYQPIEGCAYENHTSWPQFLYAKGNTGAYFASEEYGLASVMAVWVYHD